MNSHPRAHLANYNTSMSASTAKVCRRRRFRAGNEQRGRALFNFYIRGGLILCNISAFRYRWKMPTA